MNILIACFVDATNSNGGREKWLISFQKHIDILLCLLEQKTIKAKITFVSIKAPKEPSEHVNWIEVDEFRNLKARNKFKFLYHLPERDKRFNQRIAFDIVIGVGGLFEGVFLKAIDAWKKVYWFRHADELTVKSRRNPFRKMVISMLQKRVINCADLLLFNGEDMRSFINKSYKGGMNHPSNVIPNFIDPDFAKIADIALSRREYTSSNTLNLCYFGRLTFDKIGDLESLIKYLSIKFSVSLLVIGNGDKQLFGNLSRLCKLKVIGYVENKRIPEQITDCEFSIFPSKLVRYGGVSNSLIEAMYMGLIPIVRDVPAYTQVVDNMHNGIVFRKPEEAAEYISGILWNTSKIREMSMLAHSIAKKYTIERHFQELTRSITELVKQE